MYMVSEKFLSRFPQILPMAKIFLKISYLCHSIQESRAMSHIIYLTPIPLNVWFWYYSDILLFWYY